VPGKDQEGNIREVDADGNMQPYLPSPMPVHELGPPLAYFEAQVPAAAVARGGMWEGSDAEKEPLEMTEDEAPAPPPAPPAPAASAPATAGGDPEGPEDPEDPDDEDDDENDQDDDPPEERTPYCVYTSFHEV